jgi:hypothetical protein
VAWAVQVGSDSINKDMTGEELRESWQGRALALAELKSIQLKCALISLFADNYDDTLPFLLAAVFGDWCITSPFYCSNPKIDKHGCIVADLIMPDGRKLKDTIIFDDTDQMQGIFRKLADRFKLTDAERLELFFCVHHWVKADLRLDPTMDRSDPEAKRLTVH